MVSFWLDAPSKFWAWAVGAAIDVVLSVVRDDGGSGRSLARLNQMRHDDHRQRDVPDLVAVGVDRRHLDERLGLFVIIVLGEAVMQLVYSAATAEWTTSFEWVALASFVGLWRTTFAVGFTGAPHTSLADLPPRFGLPLHLVSTIGLVLLATGLGILLTESAAGHVEPAVGWLVAGGMAAHLGVALVAGLPPGRPGGSGSCASPAPRPCMPRGWACWPPTCSRCPSPVSPSCPWCGRPPWESGSPSSARGVDRLGL